MWGIFGGEFSINVPQENWLKFCHQELHQILHCKKKKFVTWNSLWEHPRPTSSETI